MGAYNSRTTSVVFQDTDGSDQITVGPGDGDFSLGETNSDNAERTRLLNRGVFDGFVVTDDLEQDFSITIRQKIESITSGAQDRIYDFVNKTGNFASANSTSSDIWAWKTEVTMTDGTTTATMVLPVCQGSISYSEGKEFATYTISGTNNGTIVVT